MADSQIWRKVVRRQSHSLDFDVVTLECGHVVLTGQRRKQETCYWCASKSSNVGYLKPQHQGLSRSIRATEKETQREYRLPYKQEHEQELPRTPAACIWLEPSTSVLTCRELTIAHMVAQGKPNQIIAHELYLREYEVKRHISKICRKIGVRSRLAIAVWVSRQAGTTAP
jgi:DNA-binding NarL/FixJ family response regulator